MDARLGKFNAISLDDGNDYSYHKYEGNQWLDYNGGIIFGTKVNKDLGTFSEGKYNKYWNREWYDFKLGVNYVIFNITNKKWQKN